MARRTFVFSSLPQNLRCLAHSRKGLQRSWMRMLSVSVKSLLLVSGAFYVAIPSGVSRGALRHMGDGCSLQYPSLFVESSPQCPSAPVRLQKPCTPLHDIKAPGRCRSVLKGSWLEWFSHLYIIFVADDRSQTTQVDSPGSKGVRLASHASGVLVRHSILEARCRFPAELGRADWWHSEDVFSAGLVSARPLYGIWPSRFTSDVGVSCGRREVRIEEAAVGGSHRQAACRLQLTSWLAAR